MSLLQNSNAISAGGYDINNSLRFRASGSASLSRTPSSNSTSTTIRTFSAWVKRGLLSSSTRYTLFYQGVSAGSGQFFLVEFQNDSIRILYDGAAAYNPVTAAVFRDPSAWYHIVVTSDTTQATSSDRTKIYVNGVSQTITGTQPPQNYTAVNGTTSIHNVGAVASANYFDGYMAEVNFIDGQALTPSSFGETDPVTGSWVAKKYTGTYGTNGFYLKFSDIATTSGSNAGLGKDFSGNTNYFNTTNISVTAGTTYDAMTDVPTNTSATVANYCVMNPLNKLSGATAASGNLNVQTSGSSGATINGTFGVSSGKWYWETTLTASTDATIFGIDEITELPNYPGNSTTSYSYYPVSAIKINNSVQTSYGVTATTNDVIGCALDMDNGKIWWSKNGTWMASGDPAAGTNAAFTSITGTKTPAIGDGSSGSDVNVHYNFGQRPFSYTPPTGFKSLNTYNLPDSTIKKGNRYMDSTLYTGTGSALTVTNAGSFKPDFVWIKSRSNAYSHGLFDSVRGALKVIQSSSTAAEATESAGTSLTGFNSNGFALGTNGSTVSTNVSAATFVGWQWQAGQGSTTTGTGTGGITSVTQSVNTTAGFSVVTYTGSGTTGTITHGLGVAPSMIFTKTRSSAAGNWGVYHSAIGATKVLNLNLTNAAATSSAFWNNTAPTLSVFTVATSNDVNASATTYVAYCWAEIAGFSKFGSYTGNGSADGPFVFCGFRPRFILWKRTDAVSDWGVIDTARDTYNTTGYDLTPNSSAAEGSGYTVDFLSNGFKIRLTATRINASGGTYIFMAFAENPFKNANAR